MSQFPTDAPSDVTGAAAEVYKDMIELAKLDTPVPQAAFDYVAANQAEIEEFRISMRIHEISDFVISMGGKL